MFSSVRGIVLVGVAAIVSVDQAGAQAVAPAKVAIINLQKAVGDTAEMKKAQAALAAKYGPQQTQIQNLQRDLQNIQQQLNSPNLAPSQESQLRADGTQKQKQYQRLTEDLQADVNNERQDIIGRAGRQMSEVVRKLAEERGVDVVIDASTTLYFKPALDLTAEATAAYDKAYPAK